MMILQAVCVTMSAKLLFSLQIEHVQDDLKDDETFQTIFDSTLPNPILFEAVAMVLYLRVCRSTVKDQLLFR